MAAPPASNESRIDILLSQGGEGWGHAASVIFLEGAGGRFRDPDGGRRIDLRGGTYANHALDLHLDALLERW